MPDELEWADFEPDDPDDGFLPNPSWRTAVLNGRNAELENLPIVRYVQIQMTPQTANEISRVARLNGTSRQGWIRKVVAQALSYETGKPFEEVFAGFRPGTHNRDTRPETTRDR